MIISKRDIIVIGASAGGVESLKEIVSSLPENFSATLFIVQHTSASGRILADILNAAGPLPALFAEHGAPYQRGHIYIAPPDHHLLLRGKLTLLTRGPRENRTRPSIDPLFRSAAVSCRSRVIGVILSGYLGDGASGLDTVKRCGGRTVVLDPKSTPYPDMPANALGSVEVDFCLPLLPLSKELVRLTQETAPEPLPIPHDLEIEIRIAEKAMSDAHQEKKIGETTTFACPDCQGPLYEIEDSRVKRFRCQIGHGFTESALLNGQSDAVENALWIALRSLEDRGRMLKRLMRTARSKSHSLERFVKDFEENVQHIEQIRNVLLSKQSVVSLEE